MNSSATLGIICGGGDLPLLIAESCIQEQRPFFIAAIEGTCDLTRFKTHPHASFAIGHVGAAIKRLKAEGITQIVFAGGLQRPSLSGLKVDLTGAGLLAKLATAKNKGDDALLQIIVQFFEHQGFEVVGADGLLHSLLAHHGVYTDAAPDTVALADITLGAKAAHALGKLDIGQAVIVQEGRVVAVEAAEGTAKLLARAVDVLKEGHGGVLVKMKKPGQEHRVDLPSIGIETIEQAAHAGLRGIAIEAGGALILSRDAVIAQANKLGLFLYGVSADA